MLVKTEVQLRCGISHEPMEVLFVVIILSQIEVLHLFIHHDHLKDIFTVKLYVSLSVA